MSGYRLITAWRDAILGSGARMLVIALGLITVPITTRVLGPDGRGAMVAALAWAGLFATILYLSLGQVAIHHLTGNRERGEVRKVLGTLLWFLAVFTTIGWLAAAALWFITDGALYGGLPVWLIVVAMASLPFLIWNHYGASLLQAIAQIPRSALATSVSAVVIAILLVIFLGILGYGLGAVILINLFGGAVTFIILLIGIWMGVGGRPTFSFSLARTFLSGGAKLHWNALGTFLFSTSDILILNFFRTTTEVGWYQLAYVLVGLLLILPTAMSASLYTMLTRTGPDIGWKRSQPIFFGVGGIVLIGIILAYPLAPILVPLVAGPEFKPSINLFRILLLAVIGMTVSILLSSQWITRGFFVMAGVLTIGTGLLNLFLNLWAIPIWGANGAAWTTVTAYSVALLINIGVALLVFRTRANRIH